MREQGFYWVEIDHPAHHGDPVVVARWEPNYFADREGAFVYDGSWYLDGQAARCLSEKIQPPEVKP